MMLKVALSVLVVAGLAAAATREETAAPGMAQQGYRLEDAQVAGVVKAANESEIQAAKMALDRARSKEVKNYARMMQTDHKKNDQQLGAVLKTLGIEPQESEVSKQMREGSQKQAAQMAGMKGNAFDQAYIDSQVSAHREVLRQLDAALTEGQAHDQQFSTLLQQTRDTVQRHLEHAERLQQNYGSGSTNTNTRGSEK